MANGRNVATGVVVTTATAVASTAPTTAQIVTANAARVVDGAITVAQAERIALAALAGKRAGLGTATEQYIAQDGTTPRITLTPDANGNGTPTLNGV